MTAGTRRALGSLGILVFLLMYIVVAFIVGVSLSAAPWWVQMLYYAVAGIAWVFPLRPLFQWMGKPSA